MVAQVPEDCFCECRSTTFRHHHHHQVEGDVRFCCPLVLFRVCHQFSTRDSRPKKQDPTGDLLTQLLFLVHHAHHSIATIKCQLDNEMTPFVSNEFVKCLQIPDHRSIGLHVTTWGKVAINTNQYQESTRSLSRPKERCQPQK